MRHTLMFCDFPRPEVARQLSPNGRVHWAERRLARIGLQQRVWAEAHHQALPPMHGLVVIRPTWTFPSIRTRDGDNLTATLKCLIDALVRGKWLVDDSSEYVRLEPPVVRVERGKRMLMLEFETNGRTQ
jgi:hypothetical protein